MNPVYAPLIAAAVAVYRNIWQERLLEVRLLGSVARGEAMVQSDIDFVGLVDLEPHADDILLLEDHAFRLRGIYPVVPRVDLEVEFDAQLSPFRQFVLSSDSLCVFGRDRLTCPSQTMERGDLAQLVTPDAAAMIHDYRQAIGELSDEATITDLTFWSRIVGKDLLKCLRGDILRQGGDYEPSIGGISSQVASTLPESVELAEALIALYRQPSSGRHELIALLDRAELVLVPTAKD